MSVPDPVMDRTRPLCVSSRSETSDVMRPGLREHETEPVRIRPFGSHKTPGCRGLLYAGPSIRGR